MSAVLAVPFTKLNFTTVSKTIKNNIDSIHTTNTHTYANIHTHAHINIMYELINLTRRPLQNSILIIIWSYLSVIFFSTYILLQYT